jgi:hypothetical protein
VFLMTCRNGSSGIVGVLVERCWIKFFCHWYSRYLERTNGFLLPPIGRAAISSSEDWKPHSGRRWRGELPQKLKRRFLDARVRGVNQWMWLPRRGSLFHGHSVKRERIFSNPLLYPYIAHPFVSKEGRLARAIQPFCRQIVGA